MRKSITLNIAEPCHEDWSKMTPKEKGRHCAACNKTVIDFTKQTDEQIIIALENKGDLCGRFKNQQLDREIVLARKDRNNYMSWAASGLFAFIALGSQKSFAQGAPKIVQTDSIKPTHIKGKIATSVLNKKVVSGTVTNFLGELPVEGVSVIIKGTALGTVTDKKGKYKIKAKKGDILVFSYLGFEKREVIIKESKVIDIKFKESHLEIMGEVQIYEPKSIKIPKSKHDKENKE
ncbi:carboxypeptidase-like regulatory domain-containing protein [Winogradskyella sp. R77965]|uniref:carboxypeptidase-like regulatory domain-containing protein n=1 Tax=Winogradskyella sp. R77965 TaxID=3093872 RepID=UPI0037DCB96D